MAVGFDPAQPLPEDDNSVLTVPLGVPNQFGGRTIGAPQAASNPVPFAPTPSPVPGDIVVNPAAMPDPAARAAYIAAHPAGTGVPGVDPSIPAAAPAASLPADQQPPNSPPSAVPPVTPTARPGGVGAGGGAGLPQGSADLQKEIAAGTADEKTQLQNVADEKELAGQKLADEYARREDLRRQQAADLAAEQNYVRERQQALNKEDEANLNAAKNKVIPDFWAGHEGLLAGAAITVGLAGAAGALTGSTHNTALEAIQHNVDTYYDREREKVNNLYKFAEAKGRLNDQIRAQLQGQVTDLMQQHALTLASAADRIEQVQAESQGRVDAAQAKFMASQLRAKAATEMAQARDLDIKIYDSKTRRIDANAAAARAQAEATRAKAEVGDKEDEKAFTTYAKSTYGKPAETLKLRLNAFDSAQETLKNPNASSGEVVGAIEKAIAADSGEGKRGVSMGQLHTMIPNLVSGEGKISDKVSNNWDGTAGKEFRAAAERLVGDAKRARESEYQRSAREAEKGLGQMPYYKKHPEAAKAHAGMLYPERQASAPEQDWRPIPRNMAGAPQLKGKTQVLVDANGNVVDAR